MARARKRAIHRGDLGPIELQQHGDWRVLELPVLGRRLQRLPAHERLWHAGKLPSEAYEAGERFAREWATAEGARWRTGLPQRVDGAIGKDADDFVIEALAWLRRAREAAGATGYGVVERICGRGESLSATAAAVLGYANEKSRHGIEEILSDALVEISALDSVHLVA